MKNFKKHMLLICMLAIGLASSAQTTPTFTQNEFIFGVYGDPLFLWETPPTAPLAAFPPNGTFQSRLSLLSEAHFNLLSGFQNQRENHRLANEYYLSELQNFNASSTSKIKLLVRDWRWDNYDNTSDKFYTPSYSSGSKFHFCTYCDEGGGATLDFYNTRTQELKDQIYGFHLKDEPTIPSPERVLHEEWNNNMKSAFPDKIVFINLYDKNSYPGNNTDYENYLDSYLSGFSSHPLDVVCFDSYPIRTNLSKGHLENYFYSLQTMREKAVNRPLWAYVNAIEQGGSYAIPNPTVAHLRYTSFCPLAYGAKGLIQFMYETSALDTPVKQFKNYIISKTISSPYATTDKYHEIKNINNFIKNTIGVTTITCDYIGSYHKKNEYGDVDIKLLDKSADIDDVNEEQMLFGVFKEKNSSTSGDFIYDYYNIWVVNKDFNNPSNTVELDLNYHIWDNMTISPLVGDKNNPYVEGTAFDVVPDIASFPPSPYPICIGCSPMYEKTTKTKTNSLGNSYTKNVTRVYIPGLQPGEGRLIKLRKATYGSTGGVDNGNQPAKIVVSPNPLQTGNNNVLFNNTVSEHVTIKLVNSQGTVVGVLMDEQLNMGQYNITLNTDAFNLVNSNKTYFITLTTPSNNNASVQVIY